MELKNIIINRITREGAISFHDFMEMALYYPELGYYTSENEKFGKNGDYYTSPLLSDVYGHMIGVQLEEMWELMDKEPLTIVEFGAGSGALCFDILNHLKNNSSLYAQIKYYIIEKSAYMRHKQQQILHQKVEWLNNIGELKNLHGCIISNEVADNFAVHLVTMEDELKEVFIDYTNDFVELYKPATREIKNYFIQQNISLLQGHRAEINLEANEWIKQIADTLERGFVITVDYGYLSNDLYSAERKTGTLTCYYKHAINFTPYVNIGRQDITAHVNFSALYYWGKIYGLEYTGFCNQYYFLHSLGLTDYLRKIEKDTDTNNRNAFYQVYQLLMDMGNKFKVLIQQKGMQTPALKGMRFAISEEEIQPTKIA